MDQAKAAAGFCVARGATARLSDAYQRPGAAGHGLAGVLFSATPVAARSGRRCSHLTGHEAGFGLIELLVSAVILAGFSGAGVQLQASIGRATQQQQRVSEQQRWLATQLQRDAGLLQRAAAGLAIDCQLPEQRQQGLLTLRSMLEAAGSIGAPESLATQRQLALADGLLAIRVQAGELQRQRDYSLQGLGACSDELG